MRIKSLSFDMDTAGLPINEVNQLYQNFWVNKKYDWWYEVLPDDIVVDVGAGIGMFSAKALDAGAKKVYMIEPNRRLLKAAIKNVSDYIMDTDDSPVIPINAVMGKTDIHRGNIYKSTVYNDEEVEDVKLMSLTEFVGKYDLSHVDFMKIDAEGAELDFLIDHLDYFSAHVRHAAINVHIDTLPVTYERFWNFRHKFIKPFHDTNRLKFMDESLREKVFSETPLRLLPKEFMIYITNY